MTKRRQYGSGSVFQRKDGLWIGRFEAGVDRDGKRRQIKVSATTEARCKEKLEDRKREIARSGLPESGSTSRLTVAAWAEEWLNVTVTELRPKSFRADKSAVKAWIVPILGRKRLVNIGPADFRAIFTAQRAAGRGQATMIRTHVVLTKMLKDAAREGVPIAQAALLARKPLPGETDREGLALTDALAVLKIAGGRPDASRWVAPLLQGIRPSEALGLTWAAVDFDKNVIDVTWQLQALPYVDPKDKSLGFRVPDAYRAEHLEMSWHLVRPKSVKSRRLIPMTPWMRAALLDWRDKAPASPHNLVWPRESGSPGKLEDDRAEWKAIQDLADVQHPAGRAYHLHEARHTTATLLLEFGVDREVVEAILGHSKLVEAYNHADHMPRSREAMEALEERLALLA